MSDPSNSPPYTFAPPQPKRRSPSGLLLAGLALVVTLAVGLIAMFALGLGPFASATSTPSLAPSPTSYPSATPSLLPSASVGPSPSVGPSATPISSESPRTTDDPNETPATPSFTIPPTTLPGTDPTAVLLGHVPPAISPSCSPATPGEPVAAQMACNLDGGALIAEYWLYATRDEMDAAYQAFVDTAQIEPDTGDCSFYGSWPTENGYTVGGLSVGRYLCIDSSVEPAIVPYIYWTDARFNILVRATHSAGNRDRLLDFWTREAGPIP